MSRPVLIFSVNADRTHRRKDGKTTTCVHRWLIEEARGKTSVGVCTKCKEERVFYNDFWEDSE